MEQIKELQKQIEQLPMGTLICAKDRNYAKRYVNDGTTTKYLSKKSRQLAEQLAVKKYLGYLVDDLYSEQIAINSYLKSIRQHPSKAHLLLNSNSAYHELLTSYFQSISEQREEWMQASYRSNPNYPKDCLFPTVSGHRVRSKSESMIDMALSQKQIPFRYECELYIEEISYYPDFTILHPVTGKVWYWEHFGMMDNPEYVKKTFSKLTTYQRVGIIQGINLITTCETKEHPLTSDEIERTIRHYLM